ncbi:MAG: prolipoprotein diacylglyceryl transferase family protein [Anaerolineae bacterium]
MRIGPWWIDAFTLRVLGATVTALMWLKWEASRREAIREPHLGRWLLAIAIGALLLGRAGYVGIHADYFWQNPQDVLDVREIGGINGTSALLGGLIVVTVWASIGQRRFWSLLSLLAPAALWIGAGAWWACQKTGCAWGKTVSAVGNHPTWFAVEAPDLYQMVEPRYPVRIVGIGWAATMAGLAWALGKDGAWALALYMAGAAGLTLLRGDAVPMIGGVRSDTAAQGTLAVALICYGCLRGWRIARTTGDKPDL